MESYRLSVIPIVFELSMEILQSKNVDKLSQLDMYKAMGAVDTILSYLRACVEQLKPVSKITFETATYCKATREDIAERINRKKLIDGKRRTDDMVRNSLHDAREKIKSCIKQELLRLEL